MDKEHIGILYIVAIVAVVAVVGLVMIVSQNKVNNSFTASNSVGYAGLILSNVCGDCNGDGQLLGGDVTYLTRYLKGGPRPPTMWVCDVNGDRTVNAFDVTRLTAYFKGQTTLNCNQEAWYTCNDSDRGINYTTYGFVTGKEDGTNYNVVDSCSGSVLSEQYCNGMFKATQSYTCPYGCSNGRCNAAPQNTCTDSDGGINYDVYGFTNGTMYGIPVTQYDMCNNSVLVERYCDLNQSYYFMTVNYNCQYGCSNGRCNAAQFPDLTILTSWYENISGQPDNKTIHTLVKNIGTAEAGANNLFVSISNGTWVQNLYGLYVPTLAPGAQIDVVGSAIMSNGINYYTGTVDVNNVIIESNENNNAFGNTFWIPGPDSCSETDGGLNYELRGSVSGFIYGYPYLYNDTCSNSTRLLEYYCQVNNGYSYEYYFCQNGCSNGACNPAPQNTCTDSDGGNSPWVYGYVSGMNNSVNYTYYDTCYGQNGLQERYCNGNIATYQLLACPQTCSNGRCYNTTQSDLVILNAYVVPNPPNASNNTYTVATVVKNIGTESTGIGFYLRVNLNGTGGVDFDSIYVPVLPPNQEYIANSNANISIGTYIYTGYVDYTYRIIETNENNNQYTTMLTVP